jgi:hypothetical protein
MREAILIFKKDVRRLRVQLAVYLGLMALFAWMEASSPQRLELHQAASFCEILLLLAAWYLTVMASHQETLPGDQQYWLTRPLSWRSLLLAKTLFVVVFFQLPVLVSNVVTLLANGLSPLAYIEPLLVKQAFLTASLVLPAMALSAVTRNFGQFVIWIFGAFAAILLIGLELQEIAPGPSWGGYFWMVESALGLALLLGLTILLLLQYAHRRTLQSQTILGAGLLVCSALPAINLWHVAFALQGRWASHPEEASAIRLAFDPARDLAPGRGVLGTRRVTESMVRILLPVQVTGIPSGMEILSERIAVMAEIPGGARWSSGWTDLGGTLHPAGDSSLLPENGPYWQHLYIDRAYFVQTRNAPVHLRTTAAFTLLSHAQTARLTPPTFARPVPDFGFCTARANQGGISNTIRGSMSLACLAPFQHADWTLVRIQSRRTGQFQTVGTRQDVSYSPYPTDVSAMVWTAVRAAMLVVDPSNLDFVLEARSAEAHFERTLDIPEIRLEQFRDTPAGAMR